jgi:hypothetical protein
MIFWEINKKKVKTHHCAGLPQLLTNAVFVQKYQVYNTCVCLLLLEPWCSSRGTGVGPPFASHETITVPMSGVSLWCVLCYALVTFHYL